MVGHTGTGKVMESGKPEKNDGSETFSCIWYVCSYCARTFPQKHELTRHKKETHYEEIRTKQKKEKEKVLRKQATELR